MNDKYSAVVESSLDETSNTMLGKLERRSSARQYLRDYGEETSNNFEIDLNSLKMATEELSKQAKLTAAQKQAYRDLKSLETDILNTRKTKTMDLTKQARTQQELAEALLKVEDLKLDIALKNKALTQAEIDDLIKVYNLNKRIANAKIDDAKKLIKATKDANTSSLQIVGDSLKSFSKEIGELSRTLNLDKLTSGEEGSLRATRKQTMVNLGISSTQFNDFKNAMIGEMKTMNANAGGALFSLDDVTWYLNSLNSLGIYNTELAKSQLEAATTANKILNMSVDTQSKIITAVKKTGNTDLLKRSTETIATLLESDIALSRERLNEVAGSTADLVTQMAYLGLTSDAASALQTSTIAGRAAAENAWDSNTSDALYSILSDLAINKTGSQYVSATGGNYNKIQNALNSGDYGSALDLLINSSYASAMANMDNNALALRSTQDQALAFASRNKGNFNYSAYTQAANGDSSALNKLIKTQEEALTWQEKLSNSASLIWGQLDWQLYIGLANTAFALYIASASINAIGNIWRVLSKLDKTVLSQVPAIGKWFSSTSLASTSILAIAGTLSLIAGAVLMIVDGFKSMNSEENKNTYYGGSGLASFVGGSLFGSNGGGGGSNALKNALKWGLIGAGIGTIIPGVGNLAGFIIGGIAGLLFGGLTGYIGGGKILSTFTGYDSNNTTVASGMGGVSSNSNLYGMGDGDNHTTSSGVSVPWTISSRYGPRKSFKTSAGWTSSFHAGIDLAKSPQGSAIGANVAGQVIEAGYSGGGGNYVYVQDLQGLVHKYFHMKDPSPLSKGDWVNAGQIVGYMGSTGRSTGSHLHYGVSVNGKSVDPEGYITSNLWNASATGNIISNTDTQETKSPVLAKYISENTKQIPGLYATSNVGDGDAIVSSVNTGFSNLISKLDSLANRQDEQEKIIQALSGNSSTKLYRY